MSFKLTEQQQRIVKHPSGHARVLAVAGSGKTFTMGHRIKYLIKERGVSPKKIRVLMFNSLAKKQFVERLLELDFSNSELPYVATFHGFAFQFIQHLKNKSMIPKKKFWTGDDEEKATILIHKTMEELMKEKTIPAPESIEESLDIKEIKEAISRYKGALIPPVRAGHHFNKFIPIIYNRYEQKRSELNALTFDDFIPTVINILENNEQLRNIWSEKADYLIVDEYQDVNYGQQKLIEVLAGNKAEVMVVGDDDQTIYEWRGARPNYIIRDFMSAFDNKPHSTYKLSYSFRFGPMIAQTAQNTILHNTNRVEKELIAFNPKIESYLRFYKGGEGSSTEWHKQMTQELIRLVKGQNVLPEKIWILGRTYSQLGSMEMLLLSYKVPYKILGGRPFFKRAEIQKLLKYLQLAGEWNKRITQNKIYVFLEILNYPNRRIPSQIFLNVLQSAIGKKATWGDYLEWMIGDDGLGQLELWNEKEEDFINFVHLLRQINAQMEEENVGEILEKIVNETNLMSHFDNFYGKGETSFERKGMINNFVVFAKELKIHALEFPSYISNLDSTRGAPNEQLITMSTVHKTKGLEFDYVFIPSCLEGFMPCHINDASEIFDKDNPDFMDEGSLNIENERRLFYVAITRAKKGLYIATVEGGEQESKLLPSRFLEEILYQECNDTFHEISTINSWPGEKTIDWLKRIKKYAGRKGLLRNLEKYLQVLNVDHNIFKRIAQITVNAPVAPFSYTLTYPNLDKKKEAKKEKLPPKQTPNYWDEVKDF